MLFGGEPRLRLEPVREVGHAARHRPFLDDLGDGGSDLDVELLPEADRGGELGVDLLRQLGLHLARAEGVDAEDVGGGGRGMVAVRGNGGSDPRESACELLHDGLPRIRDRAGHVGSAPGWGVGQRSVSRNLQFLHEKRNGMHKPLPGACEQHRARAVAAKNEGRAVSGPPPSTTLPEALIACRAPSGRASAGPPPVGAPDRRPPHRDHKHSAPPRPCACSRCTRARRSPGGSPGAVPS